MPLPPGTPSGWVATIYDKELPEDPHITVRFKFKFWRISLRTGEVLDRDPPEREIDNGVLAHVQSNLTVLAKEWDRIHPHMVVTSSKAKKAKKKR